jgi:hypothetical protein
VGVLGLAAVVLTLASAPLLVSGADHLDAPTLGEIHNANDNLTVVKRNGPLDINDLYVFKAQTANRTVLAMTVNPAVNLIGPAIFDTDGIYTFNIDTNGDAVPNIQYRVTFGDPDANGVQHYNVKLNDREVASGFTNNARGQSTSRDGVKAFAGMRSDPFFFDLLAFLGTVKHEGTSSLLDNVGHDFFTPLNTQAIVVELPNAALGGNGADIGVWATTRKGEMPVDQMGRPAINTVFNGTPAAKEAFNATRPNKQRTAMGGLFRNNVINTLLAFSALDPTNPAYTQAQAAGLADVLLPDMLTYKVGTVAAGPLNGRGLADDVIDAELNIVTGGYPFPGRDAIGGITGDHVGPHTDYTASFPYLGAPH